jgi:hypothetical protein
MITLKRAPLFSVQARAHVDASPFVAISALIAAKKAAVFALRFPGT